MKAEQAASGTEAAYQRRWEAVAAIDRGIGQAETFWARIVAAQERLSEVDAQRLDAVERGLEFALAGVRALKGLTQKVEA